METPAFEKLGFFFCREMLVGQEYASPTYQNPGSAKAEHSKFNVKSTVLLDFFHF